MSADDGSSANLDSALDEVLERFPARVVACSGGIDSLLLATLAHRRAPNTTTVVHTVTPAVPAAATARVTAYGLREGWDLKLVRSREFEDERYLENPTNRCYFCKSNLYTAIGEVGQQLEGHDHAILSGANTDDLGEYRPGLIAADEHQVAHPYIEAGWGKDAIRSKARRVGLDEAELPASPCLASRLYTGTRVTAARLQAIEAGEAVIAEMTDIRVVRCRIRDDRVLIEVPDEDRHAVDAETIHAVTKTMTAIEPGLQSVDLDDKPYRAGRSFLQVS